MRAKVKPGRERMPNEVRRAVTRKAVLAAARTLFVQNGYVRTTVDDIAGLAGVSKGGIYFHFPDKADIVRELLLQSAELYQGVLRLLQSKTVSPVERLIGYTNWVSRLGAKDPHSMLLPILISLEFLGSGHEIEALVSEHYKAIYRGLTAAIEDGRRLGLLNVRSGSREQAATIVLLGDGALLEWLRRSDLLDGAKLVRALQQFILDAMATPKYRKSLGNGSRTRLGSAVVVPKAKRLPSGGRAIPNDAERGTSPRRDRN